MITADEGMRGGKQVPLKANVDAALAQCPAVERGDRACGTTGAEVAMTDGPRPRLGRRRSRASRADCPPEEMGAEDPLFILYTSGSTGKPKGVLHTTGGYCGVGGDDPPVHVRLPRRGEIYWCAADIGWVTGHSYVVYGPLANGATTVMFEGVPNWPDSQPLLAGRRQAPGRDLLRRPDRAARADARGRRVGDARPSRQSLRLLGTVGEPINPEAWEWYYRVVGEGRCPIVDTWWQTETGGGDDHPAARRAPTSSPGSATRPMFGVEPQLVDGEGKVLEGAGEGDLVHHRQLARPDAHRLGRPRALLPDLFHHLSRASISPATAAAATRTAITGSPAGSTT